MKKGLLIATLSVILSGIVSYVVAGKVSAQTNEVREFKNELINEQNDNRQDRKIVRSDKDIMTATYFSDAAELAVNSVVYVKVVKRAARQQSPSSMFDYFFGFANTPQDQVGIGSGVIISEDGYIVTNNHVVSGADEVQVTLYDNSVHDARVIGTDEATDLALLKVDGTGFQALEMGDSDELRLGEWVLAIGSPYDLRSTITAGIVSAKGRSFPNYDGSYRIESFIQTDAAVNPGNSGGALVNTSGQLVGINTSIVSLTGSYTGYAFAVPVNIVKKITDDFIEYGSVQRAVLGIAMRDSDQGVVIADVRAETPASAAGLKPGDIIKEINLNQVKTASEVQVQVGKLRPGEKAVVTVLRDNVQKEIMVNL
ncbi:MAG: trypsin-like peptidase domain-containing protein [Bacteroidales bacterium]|nr:trypsin-like peptidase domain-containing protein [Bacteroidales bacterium]